MRSFAFSAIVSIALICLLQLVYALPTADKKDKAVIVPAVALTPVEKSAEYPTETPSPTPYADDEYDEEKPVYDEDSGSDDEDSHDDDKDDEHYEDEAESPLAFFKIAKCVLKKYPCGNKCTRVKKHAYYPCKKVKYIEEPYKCPYDEYVKLGGKPYGDDYHDKPYGDDYHDNPHGEDDKKPVYRAAVTKEAKDVEADVTKKYGDDGYDDYHHADKYTCYKKVAKYYNAKCSKQVWKYQCDAKYCKKVWCGPYYKKSSDKCELKPDYYHDEDEDDDKKPHYPSDDKKPSY
mmetsp:Transcript_14833/g.25728  ORF Transcript_14833/g.25728 Transcript_14833/m.25728 type:complete len:290 (-) Transcript_14833:99-968(-)